MIAANEQVATLPGGPRRPGALPRPRAPGARRRSSASIDALASLGVPTPPVPEHLSGREAAAVVAQASHLIDQHVRRTGHGRAALTSLLLRSLKQARYDPEPLGHAGLGLPALLPLHLADPALPRPPLPPGAAQRGRRRRGAAAGGDPGGGGRLDERPRARRDVDRARGRRHRPLLPARARAVRGGLRARVRRRGQRPHRRGGLRRLRRGPRGDGPGPAPARRLVGAQRAGHDPGGHRDRPDAAPRATRSASGSATSTGCAAGSTSTWSRRPRSRRGRSGPPRPSA